MTDNERYILSVGDCLDVMASMDECSVDSIVTDPPYGLSFMGKGWDHSVPGTEFWEAALRVAKPGAHLLAFGGTRLFHRLAVAIEDAGWEIRDTLSWIYSSGFPKSHNGDWGGTALKPAYEPIIMARKPLIGTVAANFERHGTGGLNIDGCRVGTDIRVNGGMSSLGVMHDDDWKPREVSSEVQGRWPANLIHDGSEEVVAGFPVDKAKKMVRNRTAGARPFNNDGKPTGYETVASIDDPGGSAARFFYCAKASKRDRDEGLEGFATDIVRVTNTGHTRNPSAANGKREFTPRANHHPTVKPTDLMRYLCRLVTPTNGIIFDPFCGSGSTGKASMLEGFRFRGIDLDPEYIKISESRIQHAIESTKEPETALTRLMKDTNNPNKNDLNI